MLWIVDSSVWIDYFNGKPTPQTDTLDKALGHQEVAIGDIIFSEVLQGFRHDRDFEYAKQALLHFPIFDMVGVDNALHSAANYRRLRKQGLTIRKTVDCLIATFVIQRGFLLLHDDHDFEPFERHLGLQCVKVS